jgi:hypothetical protein
MCHLAPALERGRPMWRQRRSDHARTVSDEMVMKIRAAVRQEIEDLIGLEEYSAIAAETAEHT